MGPTRLLVFFSLALSSLPAVRGEDFFQQQVAPIFAKRCWTCHDSINPKGDLALHNSAALLAGKYIEPGLSAPEALDISGESPHILRLYGLDRVDATYPELINPAEEAAYFGRKCLIARRLLERGVRFVQIWSGNDNSFPRRNWDSHENLERDHGPLAQGMAVGAAALIKDLKQRGLLEDTIVLWTTEFGRMPSSQGGTGRDHNPYVFTNWLRGGGIRGGVSYGESDAWGYKPLDRSRPTQVYDIHATILRQLGIDHERLTVRHNGIDRRLTDVHGHVINEII